eukprot:5681665-Prymnesium_polylepis.1
MEMVGLDGWSPCHFRLAQLAAASLTRLRLPAARPRRPREAMALSLAGNGVRLCALRTVRWTRATEWRPGAAASSLRLGQRES